MSYITSFLVLPLLENMSDDFILSIDLEIIDMDLLINLRELFWQNFGDSRVILRVIEPDGSLIEDVELETLKVKITPNFLVKVLKLI